MLTTRRSARPLLTVLLAATVATCSSGGAGPSGAPVATSPADPGGGTTTSPSLDPDAPVGTDAPPGSGSGGDPGNGATLVEPQPGQLDLHPVPVQTFSADVQGRHVVLTVTWTSGVEPCAVLDSIVVDRGDHAFTITLREGHGPGDDVCIDIAMFKAAKIDLGDLEPGTYTIRDGQNLGAPIEVVVR